MLTITVEKDEVGPYVGLLVDRAADLSAPIAEVGRDLIQEGREVLASGGSGVGWAPTSPWTLALDDVLGRSRQGQLNQSGTLAQTLGDVFEASPYEGTFGTTNPVASYQQEGTNVTFFLLQYERSKGVKRTWGGRGIPPRKFLFWHDEKLPEYDEIFMEHLTGGN